MSILIAAVDKTGVLMYTHTFLTYMKGDKQHTGKGLVSIHTRSFSLSLSHYRFPEETMSNIDAVTEDQFKSS